MKRLLFSFVLVFTFLTAKTQPCKVVKPGMSKAEVLILAGPPTEIDTIPAPNIADSLRVVWQYGEPKKEGNQRVQFYGDKVDSDVVADGNKYDELLNAFQRGDFQEDELFKRINRLNSEACK